MEQKGFDLNFFIGFMLIGFLLVFMMQTTYEEPVIGCTDENALNYNPNATVSENENCNYKDESINSSSKKENKILKNEVFNLINDTISIIKNENLEIQFSNKCGCFRDVKLITKSNNDNSEYKYLSYESNDVDDFPVKLVSNKNTIISPINFVKNNNTNESFISSEEYFLIEEISNNQIIYKHPITGHLFKYTLSKNKLDFEIIGDSKFASLYFDISGPRQEKNLNSGFTSERNSSNLVYSTNQGKYKKLSFSGNDKVDDETDPISWIGYKQQFFSTIISSNSKSGFIVDYMEIIGDDLDSTVVKQMKSKIKLSKNNSFSFLFVPNDYNYLKNLNSQENAAGFENIVELGWGIFGWVNQFLVIPIFDFLENQGIGYGLIILVIALVFKMLLYLPTKKSYVSMAKMRVLKPELDELNEKYKDKDPMEKQKAQMDLYKKTGVSPLGGCLPMLLQIPILFALFKFFPSSIQLRKQPFLWADDLSTYDAVLEFSFWPGVFEHLSLFALLMSLSTVVQMKFNAQPTNTQMPQLKYMMYIMPVVFFFIMNSYSSGLSYYYLLSNIITSLQQLYIKRGLDEKKLYAQLQANKSRPVKKSNFQKRLEQIAKQQQRKRKIK